MRKFVYNGAVITEEDLQRFAGIENIPLHNYIVKLQRLGMKELSKDDPRSSLKTFESKDQIRRRGGNLAKELDVNFSDLSEVANYFINSNEQLSEKFFDESTPEENINFVNKHHTKASKLEDVITMSSWNELEPSEQRRLVREAANNSIDVNREFTKEIKHLSKEEMFNLSDEDTKRRAQEVYGKYGFNVNDKNWYSDNLILTHRNTGKQFIFESDREYGQQGFTSEDQDREGLIDFVNSLAQNPKEASTGPKKVKVGDIKKSGDIAFLHAFGDAEEFTHENLENLFAYEISENKLSFTQVEGGFDVIRVNNEHGAVTDISLNTTMDNQIIADQLNHAIYKVPYDKNVVDIAHQTGRNEDFIEGEMTLLYSGNNPAKVSEGNIYYKGVAKYSKEQIVTDLMEEWDDGFFGNVSKTLGTTSRPSAELSEISDQSSSEKLEFIDNVFLEVITAVTNLDKYSEDMKSVSTFNRFNRILEDDKLKEDVMRSVYKNMISKHNVIVAPDIFRDIVGANIDGMEGMFHIIGKDIKENHTNKVNRIKFSSEGVAQEHYQSAYKKWYDNASLYERKKSKINQRVGELDVELADAQYGLKYATNKHEISAYTNKINTIQEKINIEDNKKKDLLKTYEEDSWFSGWETPKMIKANYLSEGLSEEQAEKETNLTEQAKKKIVDGVTSITTVTGRPLTYREATNSYFLNRLAVEQEIIKELWGKTIDLSEFSVTARVGVSGYAAEFRHIAAALAELGLDPKDKGSYKKVPVAIAVNAGLKSENFEGFFDENIGPTSGGRVSKRDIDLLKNSTLDLKQIRREIDLLQGILYLDKGPLDVDKDTWVPLFINQATGYVGEWLVDGDPETSKKMNIFGNGNYTAKAELETYQEFSENYNKFHNEDIKQGKVSSFKFSADEHEHMRLSTAEKVVDGVASFVPLIIELAIANKASAALGISSRIHAAMRANRTFTFKGMTSRLAYIAHEEALMQVVGFKPMSGSTFAMGHILSGRLKLAGNFAMADPMFQTFLKSPTIGTISLEAAGLTEAAWEDVMKGGIDLETEFDHLYGDFDEVTQRLIEGFLTFAISNVHSLASKPEMATKPYNFYIKNKGNYEKAIKDLQDKVSESGKSKLNENEYIVPDIIDGQVKMNFYDIYGERIPENGNTVTQSEYRSRFSKKELAQIQSWKETGIELHSMKIKALTINEGKFDPSSDKFDQVSFEKFIDKHFSDKISGLHSTNKDQTNKTSNKLEFVYHDSTKDFILETGQQGASYSFEWGGGKTASRLHINKGAKNKGFEKMIHEINHYVFMETLMKNDRLLEVFNKDVIDKMSSTMSDSFGIIETIDGEGKITKYDTLWEFIVSTHERKKGESTEALRKRHVAEFLGYIQEKISGAQSHFVRYNAYDNIRTSIYDIFNYKGNESSLKITTVEDLFTVLGDLGTGVRMQDASKVSNSVESILSLNDKNFQFTHLTQIKESVGGEKNITKEVKETEKGKKNGEKIFNSLDIDISKYKKGNNSHLNEEVLLRTLSEINTSDKIIQTEIKNNELKVEINYDNNHTGDVKKYKAFLASRITREFVNVAEHSIKMDVKTNLVTETFKMPLYEGKMSADLYKKGSSKEKVLDYIRAERTDNNIRLSAHMSKELGVNAENYSIKDHVKIDKFIELLGADKNPIPVNNFEKYIHLNSKDAEFKKTIIEENKRLFREKKEGWREKIQKNADDLKKMMENASKETNELDISGEKLSKGAITAAKENKSVIERIKNIKLPKDLFGRSKTINELRSDFKKTVSLQEKIGKLKEDLNTKKILQSFYDKRKSELEKEIKTLKKKYPVQAWEQYSEYRHQLLENNLGLVNHFSSIEYVRAQMAGVDGNILIKIKEGLQLELLKMIDTFTIDKQATLGKGKTGFTMVDGKLKKITSELGGELLFDKNGNPIYVELGSYLSGVNGLKRRIPGVYESLAAGTQKGVTHKNIGDQRGLTSKTLSVEQLDAWKREEAQRKKELIDFVRDFKLNTKTVKKIESRITEKGVEFVEGVVTPWEHITYKDTKGLSSELVHDILYSEKYAKQLKLIREYESNSGIKNKDPRRVDSGPNKNAIGLLWILDNFNTFKKTLPKVTVSTITGESLGISNRMQKYFYENTGEIVKASETTVGRSTTTGKEIGITTGNTIWKLRDLKDITREGFMTEIGAKDAYLAPELAGIPNLSGVSIATFKSFVGIESKNLPIRGFERELERIITNQIVRNRLGKNKIFEKEIDQLYETKPDGWEIKVKELESLILNPRMEMIHTIETLSEMIGRDRGDYMNSADVRIRHQQRILDVLHRVIVNDFSRVRYSEFGKIEEQDLPGRTIDRLSADQKFNILSDVLGGATLMTRKQGNFERDVVARNLKEAREIGGGLINVVFYKRLVEYLDGNIKSSLFDQVFKDLTLSKEVKTMLREGAILRGMSLSGQGGSLRNSFLDKYSGKRDLPKEVLNSEPYKKFLNGYIGNKLFHSTRATKKILKTEGTNLDITWFALGKDGVNKGFGGETVVINSSDLAGKIIPDLNFLNPIPRAIYEKHGLKDFMATSENLTLQKPEFIIDVIDWFNKNKDTGFVEFLTETPKTLLYGADGKLANNVPVAAIGRIQPEIFQVLNSKDIKLVNDFKKDFDNVLPINGKIKTTPEQRVLGTLDFKEQLYSQLPKGLTNEFLVNKEIRNTNSFNSYDMSLFNTFKGVNTHPVWKELKVSDKTSLLSNKNRKDLQFKISRGDKKSHKDFTNDMKQRANVLEGIAVVLKDMVSKFKVDSNVLFENMRDVVRVHLNNHNIIKSSSEKQFSTADKAFIEGFMGRENLGVKLLDFIKGKIDRKQLRESIELNEIFTIIENASETMSNIESKEKTTKAERVKYNEADILKDVILQTKPTHLRELINRPEILLDRIKLHKELFERNKEIDKKVFNSKDIDLRSNGDIKGSIEKINKANENTKELRKSVFDSLTKGVSLEHISKTKVKTFVFEGLFDISNLSSAERVNLVLDKYIEGYNDIRFSNVDLYNDKHLKNIIKKHDFKHIVTEADLKEIATRTNTDKLLEGEIDRMLERRYGVDRELEVSDQLGRRKSRKIKDWWMGYGASDLEGLLYPLLGKGKQGVQDMQFFNETLIRPYLRGIQNLRTFNRTLREELGQLKKDFKGEFKRMHKDLGGNYSWDNMLRVYLWDRAGVDKIPGITDKERENMIENVTADSNMFMLAERLLEISRTGGTWTQPKKYWASETLEHDIYEIREGSVGRSYFLREFIENYEAIFTNNAINKASTVLGDRWAYNFKERIDAMMSGRTRKARLSKGENEALDWINMMNQNTMFFNMRSAVTQLISNMNYMDHGTNNPLAHSRAIANVPQFIKDFQMIYNSDYLVERRGGALLDITAQEMKKLSSHPDQKGLYKFMKKHIAKMLEVGYTPTRMADSFAIALGGAPYYRNYYNKYIKQGMSPELAHEKAWLDFVQKTEPLQQSSDPMYTSSQQSQSLTKGLLGFKTTPLQYTRHHIKKIKDTYFGRGNPLSNISTAMYYGPVQAYLFYFIQQALWTSFFSDEEEYAVNEKDEMELTEYGKNQEYKKNRFIENQLNSYIQGFGVGGVLASTAINTVKSSFKEAEKGYRGEWGKVIESATQAWPALSSKVRQLRSVFEYQANKYHKQDIAKEMPWYHPDNPRTKAISSGIAFITNAPTNRMQRKAENLQEVADETNATYQRVGHFAGFSRWDMFTHPELYDSIDEKLSESRKEKGGKSRSITYEKKRFQKYLDNPNQSVILYLDRYRIVPTEQKDSLLNAWEGSKEIVNTDHIK